MEVDPPTKTTVAEVVDQIRQESIDAQKDAMTEVLPVHEQDILDAVQTQLANHPPAAPSSAELDVGARIAASSTLAKAEEHLERFQAAESSKIDKLVDLVSQLGSRVDSTKPRSKN